MKILKLEGEIENLISGIGIQHTIVADFENKSIDILGNRFDPKELEKLAHWIDIYQQKTQEIITLNYWHIGFKYNGIRTFNFLYPPDYPIFPIAEEVKNIFDNFDLFEAYMISPLGEVLSKFGKFNFMVEEMEGTPKVEVDYDKGEVFISKRAIMYQDEIYFTFFPVMVWLAEFYRDKNKQLTVIMKLEYFNTIISKTMLEFFDFLKKLELKSLKIIWLYHEDDEDMKEAGGEFRDILNLGDNMILESY